jgi:hypothetical protein
MSSIEAKPTEYKGTLYRSRLEARWAVYLDVHPNIFNVIYEPALPKVDFCFGLAGSGLTICMQVKPANPSEEYLRELMKVVEKFYHPFILSIGDFYNGEPVIYDLTKQMLRIPGYPLSSTVFSNAYALRSASGYRFDLANPEAPRKGRPNVSNAPTRKKRRRRRR